MKTQPHVRAQLRDAIAAESASTPEDRFLVWFIKTYYGDATTGTTLVLTNGRGDAGVDALVTLPNASYSSKPTIIILHCTYSESYFSAHPRAALLGKQQYFEFGNIVSAFDTLSSLNGLFDGSVPETKRKLYRDVIDKRDSHGYEVEFVAISLRNRSAALESRTIAKMRRFGHSVDQRSFLYIADIEQLFERSKVGATPLAKAITIRLEPNARINYLNASERKRSDPVSAIFALAFLQDLIDAVRGSGERLFAENVRTYQGKTVVNNLIAKTFQDEPEQFVYGHNGITVICDSFSEGTKDALTLQNPSIINGSQTLHTLAQSNVKRPAARVILRVIEVSAQRSDRYTLVANLIERSNSQNAVRIWDLRSNDAIQVRLESDFARYRIFYERKSKSWSHNPSLKNVYTAKLEMVKVAQILSVAQFGATQASNKAAMFSGYTYTLLFSQDYDFLGVFMKVAIFRIVDLAFRRIKDEAVNPRDAIWYIFFRSWKLASTSRAFDNIEINGQLILRLFDTANEAAVVQNQIAKLYKVLRKAVNDMTVDQTWNNVFKSSKSVSYLDAKIGRYALEPLRQAFDDFATTVTGP
jgi:hypothetical protein